MPRKPPSWAPLPVIVAVLACGCATEKPTLYRWGEYEQLIYEMYARPGAADPGTQMAKLSADVERTLAEGQRVPPGVHAHLGYLYYLQGNRGAALHEFSTERAVFPESAVLVDGILRRLQGTTP
ncbi:MAG: DUF4810 domain-containing protein [Deferrisomatales bacterium]|nr:DUF4810 domain-containing protein [Deferrisomatales bacterium]